MTERVQIPCEKQGRDDTSSWSTRVLTLDVATTTLTVSRHHHPNNLLYHAIHVVDVQQWPHLPHPAIRENFELLHAKRTLVVLGVEVPVPSFSLEALEGPGEQAPLPSGQYPVDTTSSTSASSNAQYAFMAGDPTKHSRPMESGGCDTWVVRFSTQDAYDTAVRVLKRMHGVHFNRERTAEVVRNRVGTSVPLMAAPMGPM